MIAVNLGAPWLQGSSHASSQAFGTVVHNLLTNIVTVNRMSLRQDARLPRLYSSGVRYIEEPPGYDSFVDIYEVLKVGGGDCAHLCAWRVAELNESGENATLCIEWRTWSDPHQPWHDPNKPKLFHVRVRRGNGQLEDPSVHLGMPVPP